MSRVQSRNILVLQLSCLGSELRELGADTMTETEPIIPIVYTKDERNIVIK